MAEFYGKLTTTHIYSFIEIHAFPRSPRKYWLLYGYGDLFEDEEQAGSAATSYIVGTKHLASGTQVIVAGEMVTVDSMPLINMSDIRSADIEMANVHFASLGHKTTGRAKSAKRTTRAKKHAPQKKTEEKQK